jgi:hypothetical protein
MMLPRNALLMSTHSQIQSIAAQRHVYIADGNEDGVSVKRSWALKAVSIKGRYSCPAIETGKSQSKVQYTKCEHG